MKGRYLKIAHGLLLLLATTAVSAELLSRDPFQPPAEFTVAPGKPGQAPLLLAGDQSLVNLGGELLGIGESANGYQLLQVGETHAVFQRGDEVITLTLYPDKKDAG